MSDGTGRSDVQLEIANAMWVDTALRLKPDFIGAAASYKASVRTLSLSSPSTVRAVNAWADGATHGKIVRVLDSASADTARLFIANAVYFNGKWLDEFDTLRTRRRDFRLASGTTIQVVAMERTGRVGYRRGTGYQMIRLPYRGGRFSMYVMLPDSGTPVGNVEREFAEHGLPASLIGRGLFRDVHVVLPRLHLSSSYDLTPMLDSLGMHQALDCHIADFQGIAIPRHSEQPDPLCISKVSQNVRLDVDEKGAEAAAITGINAVVVSLGPPPIEFIVDRPYLFMIRDEATGKNLFVGTIRHP
ncbi:MAG TPA: serpin family protein [Gemmatimonadaceae bacterium]|nr:serpin family protein [Gemmatimonadaceae bacterium]